MNADQQPGAFGVIEDGFGSVWAKCKADCELVVVRPGKVQCDPCDSAAMEAHLAEGLADGACPTCSRPWAVTWHGGECPKEVG